MTQRACELNISGKTTNGIEEEHWHDRNDEIVDLCRHSLSCAAKLCVCALLDTPYVGVEPSDQQNRRRIETAALLLHQ